MSEPTQTASFSRRERQAAHRLEHILDAAAHLFAERGFHRTTTKDIAQAADVSEGTLYNYFDNKNDLLFSILERLGEYELPTDWQNEKLAADTRQLLLQMMHLRRSFVDDNSVMLQAIYSEILANTELRQRYNQQMIAPTLVALEQILRQHADRHQIGHDVDIPASARMLVSLYLGLFLLQVLGDDLVQSQWDRLMDAFVRMVFDGIGHRPDTETT